MEGRGERGRDTEKIRLFVNEREKEEKERKRMYGF